MKTLKDCLIVFIYAVIFIIVMWGFQAGRIYYHQKTTESMVPTLTGKELKLYIPFKVKPEEEEFRLGEIYIDKQGYIRQKKGE